MIAVDSNGRILLSNWGTFLMDGVCVGDSRYATAPVLELFKEEEEESDE